MYLIFNIFKINTLDYVSHDCMSMYVPCVIKRIMELLINMRFYFLYDTDIY